MESTRSLPRRSTRMLLGVLGCILLLGSGCISHPDMAYMQDPVYMEPYLNYRTESYLVREYDNLIIRINSFDSELSDMMNQDDAGVRLTDSRGLLYFSSYTVAEDGSVNLPLLGKVVVKDKTTAEIASMLTLMMKDYENFPTVSVRLADFKVTVLGEVKAPGVKFYYSSKLTVFQALGMAGDLTPYGNRRQVKLIRETDQGTVIIPLDLTRTDLIESDYYFLRPDDVIYIEPVKARSFQLNKSNVELVTGILTTVLLFYTAFQP